nr:immunoglobulin heavy chain junction region [Mus musculus]
LCKTDRGLL